MTIPQQPVSQMLEKSRREVLERLQAVDLRGRVDDGPDIFVPLRAGHIRSIQHILNEGTGT